MTTKQGRGVTQAVAVDAATVGRAWVGVWGSIGELGAHYMCEVRFGSVLRFQLGVQKTTLLPITKTCIHVGQEEKVSRARKPISTPHREVQHYYRSQQQHKSECGSWLVHGKPPWFPQDQIQR
eukprot:COSAG01_NODE_450_length_16901_cov_7.565476_5_plen_123_part_00